MSGPEDQEFPEDADGHRDCRQEIARLEAALAEANKTLRGWVGNAYAAMEQDRDQARSDLASALKAKDDAEARLAKMAPSDEGPSPDCAHNHYWRGIYGNCLACRSEKAEAALAQAQKELAGWVGNAYQAMQRERDESRADLAALKASMPGRIAEVWDEAALYCSRNLDEAVTREVAKEQDRLREIMQERAAAIRRAAGEKK